MARRGARSRLLFARAGIPAAVLVTFSKAGNINAVLRQERVVNEQRPFIPRQMDEAGLTPAQFRVVCRVARRGDCIESIPNIAAGCRLAIGTVKKVLPFLVANNVLAKEKRTGQTSIFKVNPPVKWQVAPRPKDNLGQKKSQHPKQTDTKANSQPSHPAQTTAHKGNPLEGNPVKGSLPVFEPVKRGLYRREYEGMIQDAETEIKMAKENPANRNRVLKPDVAGHCKFLRDEAEAKPEKSAENLKRAADLENSPANYCAGLTEQGKAIVTAWKNRIEEIRRAMNGQK